MGFRGVRYQEHRRSAKLLDQNRATGKAQVQVTEQLRQFPSQLPAARASRISSWVAISVGCNNTCTFCIVPTTRGKEKDRRPGDILDEIRQCVADGAKEVTLLGQNVNSFGYGIGDRYAFSKLLRACGTIDGLERVRFTSPHPAAFTDDVIAAMAETPNIMHQLHFPLQSGSDRILRAMRRSYRSAKFLDILGRIRAAMPDAQISTDIIVGFPGETEEDFQQTMDVVRQARFSSAFTFIYSPRPGTPAAAMEQIPRDVVQDRFDRLVALQEQITEENLATFEGRDVEVMITGKLGKKDTDTHRVTGREKTGVLVHIGVPEGEPVPEIGDFVTATVTHAGRHNLLADPTWPPARPIPCGTEGVYDATSRLHRRSHRVRQDGVGHRHRPASGRSGGAGRNRERGRYQMYRAWISHRQTHRRGTGGRAAPSHRHHRPRRHDERGPIPAACARDHRRPAITWHPADSRRRLRLVRQSGHR